MEQVLAIWETQSIQESKRSPVSHKQKSVPKHKIQHATLRRRAGSKTITENKSPKVCPATCYGAAEVAPGGQWVAWPSSLRRPACPFEGPTLKSGDPSKEERSGHKGPFQGGQGWATSGGDRRVVGVGAGVGGAAAGSSTSPP